MFSFRFLLFHDLPNYGKIRSDSKFWKGVRIDVTFLFVVIDRGKTQFYDGTFLVYLRMPACIV